jgi:DNA (cytosine-5)-methyltransferase 1
VNVLDLFSGIGGFSLGLEATSGFRTVAFCEIDPFCQAVLRKHWPDVPIHSDIRTFDGKEFVGRVDVVCGGFPCQDISGAGKGAGITGARSGLWTEFARIIGEVRPRYVIVENVAMLLSRGLGRVLGDLAALGYDAEWHCIPASAIGAPHRRDRVWIVAYPGGVGSTGRREARDLACASRAREKDGKQRQWHGNAADDCGTAMADTDGCHKYGWGRYVQMGRLAFPPKAPTNGLPARTEWSAEPALGRVAHGIPNRVDCLTSLGNAVVPQIPEEIGHAIMRMEAEKPVSSTSTP